MANQSTARAPIGSVDSPPAVTDLVHYLLGDWALARTVQDQRGEEIASFSGVGQYTRRNDGLLYEEHGELRAGTWRDVARRELCYLPLSPARAAVHFPDGALFHELDLTDGRWLATHQCGADQYDGEFLVVTTDALAVRWVVRGPTKQYSIDTSFERVDTTSLARPLRPERLGAAQRSPQAPGTRAG